MSQRTVWAWIMLVLLFSVPAFGTGPQSPSATIEGPVIQINADGSGDYPTFRAAIDAAPAGATIKLAPGNYIQTEPVVITKSLKVVGAGTDITTITGQTGEYVLQISTTGSFSARGISFKYEGNGPADVVVIDAHTAMIESCSFSGAVQTQGRTSWAGLRIIGKTKGTISNCTATSNAGEGITVEDTAEIKVEGCACSDNTGCGIAYLGSATGVAQSNTCERNGRAGVVVGGTANPDIEKNVCANNTSSGIWVIQQAAPLLQANTCRGSVVGIAYFLGTPAGMAVGNSCSENVIGINVAQEAHPTLEMNTCANNERAGIGYTGSARGTVNANICKSNNVSGILVTQQSQPTLKKNVCSENKGSGIAYKDQSGGTATKNQCESNDGSGILVQDQAQPTLEANTCTDNKQAGIFYLGSAAGLTKGNTCKENEASGIFVAQQAQPSLERNLCSQNKGTGIVYAGESAGTARDNQCLNNESDGILVTEQAQPTLERNVSSENKNSGIAYFGTSSGAANANKCLSNGTFGILVSEQGHPTLKGNVCSENKGAGIKYEGQARGTSTNDRCEKNLVGISVEGHSAISIDSAVLTGNDVGILCIQTSSTTFTKCTIRDNHDSGIKEKNAATLKLSQCDITSNQGDGILITGAAELELNESQVESNLLTGIRLEDASKAVVSNCTVSQNLHGTESVGSSHLEIVGSSLSNNRYSAFDLSDSAQAHLSSTTLSENMLGFRARGTSQAVLENATITGNASGAVVTDDTNVLLKSVIIQNNARYAVLMLSNATLRMEDSSFVGNGQNDVLVGRQPYGLLTGEPVTVVIKAGGATFQAQTEPPEDVKKAVDAIVEVWPSGFDEVTNVYWEFAANGVILSSGPILTVAHVFYGEDSSNPDVWLKLTSLDVVDADKQVPILRSEDLKVGETKHGPHPAAIDPNRDLAVLYPKKSLSLGLPVAEDVAYGDPVWCVGYVGYLETGEIWRFMPGRISIPSREVIMLLRLLWLAREKKGILVPDVWIDVSKSAQTVHGMSGAPTLTPSGEVIGIMVQGLDELHGIGVSRAVDLPSLQEIIEQNNALPDLQK